MSQNDQSAPILPAATVKAILAAAGDTGPYAPEMIARLRFWLSDALAGAISRAHGKPPPNKDVDALDTAYQAFRNAIAGLQNCADPPPMLPGQSAGLTPWDGWLEDSRSFGAHPGRPDSCDWPFIVALLALYETVSGQAASANQKEGPTMRYLKRAMAELAPYLPQSATRNVRCPKPAALNRRLPYLREFHFSDEEWFLAKVFNSDR